MRSTGTEAAAICARSYRAPLLGALAWLVGLGVIIALIGAHDFDQVAAALGLADWSMILIGVVHMGVLVADTLSWRALLQHAERPLFAVMVVHRWIGSSVNGLLPTAQVGGEIVRAHLLSRAGVASPVAGAGVVEDLTAGLATQLAFVLVGIGLLLETGDRASRFAHLGAGLGILALLVLGFVLL